VPAYLTDATPGDAANPSHSDAGVTAGEPFEVVRSGYDRIAHRYRDWSHGSPVRLNWVRRLLDELPPDSLVVDLGCGPGEPATRLLAEHHRVCGVDGSAVQLRLAQHAAPTAQFVQADMTRFWLRPESVDAVASFYALGHIPSDQHGPLFAAISEWLRPGGLLLTSVPLTPGDGHDDAWLGVPMFFGGIGEPATRQAVGEAGLTVETWEVMGEDEGDGRIVEFLWLIARKPGFSR
jgi:SAM-dependent methyltransferase